MACLNQFFFTLKQFTNSLVFSPLVRLIVLRALLVISIINVAITTSALVLEVEEKYLVSYNHSLGLRWLLSSACVFVHVFFSLVVFFPFNVVYVAFYVFPLYSQWTAAWQPELAPHIDIWDLDQHIILGATAHIQMYLYTLLFILVVASVIRVGFRTFFLSFDLVDPLEGCNNHDKKFTLGVPPERNTPRIRPNRRLRFRMLFGSALAGEWDVGENTVTGFLRKLAALACFGGFIVMIGYALWVRPIHSSLMRQIKTYYGWDIWDIEDTDTLKKMEEYELSILIFSPPVLNPFINTSVIIEPQWKDKKHPNLTKFDPSISEDIEHIKEISESNCTIPTLRESSPSIQIANANEYDDISEDLVNLGVWVSRCPSRLVFKEDIKPFNKVRASLASPLYLTSPDLLISVNWTSFPYNETLLSGRDVTLLVLVGMVKDPQLVILNAQPIYLLPGMNLVANVVRYLRQMYAAPGTESLDSPSFFGTGNLRSFMAADVTSVLPDPRPPASNLTSLRIYHQYNTHGSSKIERDNAEGALLAGLSTLGGLWTASNVMFTFLFGGTLSMTLFGSKYFTHFGLIHKLNNQSLRESYGKAYPHLMTERGTKGDPHAGMATFLRDYAFDMRPLRDKKIASQADAIGERGERELDQGDKTAMSEQAAAP